MSHRQRKIRPQDNRDPGRGNGRARRIVDRRSSPRNASPAIPRRWAHNTCTVAAVCGFLLLAVALVFGQTVGYEFVNYDDNSYVYENPQVAQGLSVRSIVWAFTSFHFGNWHPLTSLSHMLDCQLYGLHAGGHHLTSVLLHAVVAILLFLVLLRITGDLWPSAFVAAVFAIHPLRAESVAWVAERKDVLSGLFFMLTLWAYAGYARRAASCVVTFFAQGEAISSVEAIPLSSRIANALVSYLAYIRDIFYPVGLAVLYPYPEGGLPIWKVVASSLAVTGISTAALVWRRRFPYLFVGWFWYVGMLV
ncbi:MAG: hypothetical protein H6Q44_1687, partial [Deltaproteobacteria bacterium]|nr:hypothetical protein [Deltaproteobacteria bacterium]